MASHKWLKIWIPSLQYTLVCGFGNAFVQFHFKAQVFEWLFDKSAFLFRKGFDGT